MENRTLRESIEQDKSVWIQFNPGELKSISLNYPEIKDKTVPEEDGLKDLVFSKLGIDRTKKISESSKIKNLLKTKGISREKLIQLLEDYKKATQ